MNGTTARASSRVVFACLAAAGLACAAAGQARYTVVDLGPIEPDIEFAWSEAGGVNALGQAVGRASTDEASDFTSTLWLQQPTLGLPAGVNDLGHLGAPGGRAYGVNDLGQVVGFVPNPDVAQALMAYRWDPDGGMVSLGDLGGPYSIAKDINNQGWVVGESKTADPVQYRHAFLHDGTQMIDLGTFGGVTSRAYAINDRGQVAGESWHDDGDPWNSRIRAFIWLPEPAYGLSAGLHDIDDYSAELQQTSRGNAINERGQIVGWLQTINEHGQAITGCGLWLPEPAYGLPSGWTNLGNIAGMDSGCFANDINDHGVIATMAKYDPDAIFGGWAAATYCQGVWTNLNDAISSEDQGRWFFESATAINNDGMIVGRGYLDGWDRAFMLVPITDDETEPCPADLDGDSAVGFGDLVELLFFWGTDSVAADLDGNGTVGFEDLTELLFAWGACPSVPTGACCFPLTGGCEDFTESLCEVYDGQWQGPDTGCANGGCPALGQGDTFDDPIVITSVPHSSTGNTAYYQNHYDEEYCAPFSSSPDVVYAYTASADRVLTISLCRNSAYDTKLSVYENAYTPGEPIACNDDACSSPSIPDAVLSEATGVQITAGNTYFIVIDGWDGQAGPFTLDITID